MTAPSEHYRHLASRAREQAAGSNLPQVKLRYLRSAQHFDERVASLERVAEAKAERCGASEGGLLKM